MWQWGQKALRSEQPGSRYDLVREGQWGGAGHIREESGWRPGSQLWLCTPPHLLTRR